MYYVYVTSGPSLLTEYYRLCDYVQVHRSNYLEEETRVDISGTLEAQLSAKLLIEEVTSKQSKQTTGMLLLCSIIF